MITERESRLKLAQGLVNARIAAGFNTATAAAKRAGMVQTTYNNYENGKTPFLHRIEELAKLFDVSPDDLRNGTIKPATVIELRINDEPRIRGSITPAHLENLNEIDGAKLKDILGSDRKSLLDELSRGAGCFTIRNPDRAMTKPYETNLVQGDILLFDYMAPIRPADLVLAKLSQYNEPIFRIFYPTDRGGAIYEALNPSIKKIIAKAGQWENLGRLQYVIKPIETLG